MDDYCRIIWWHVMLYRDHVVIYTICDHGTALEWVFHPPTCEIVGRSA